MLDLLEARQQALRNDVGATPGDELCLGDVILAINVSNLEHFLGCLDYLRWVGHANGDANLVETAGGDSRGSRRDGTAGGAAGGAAAETTAGTEAAAAVCG